MLFSFFRGTCRIDIKSGYTDRFFDAALRCGIPFRTVKPKEGFVKAATMRLCDERKAEKLLADNGCVFEIARRGLPVKALYLIRNPGLIAGIVLSVAFAVICDSFVWDVRITGNVDVPAAEIAAAAEKAGVTVGMKKSGTDERQAANVILNECPGVSFAAVNIRGAVAFIDVRERDTHEIFDKSVPSDLVARFSGVVTAMNVRSGDALVSVGDTVSEGDLLVTGTRIYESGLTYLTRSSGEIYASVNTPFTVSVPLVSEETVLTGRETVKKSVKFLTKRLNIAINSSKIPDNCDIIYEERNLTLFGMALPVYVLTERYRETEVKRTELTPDEAKAIAFSEYSEILEGLAAGGRLIAADAVSGEADGEYVISFRAEYITDIAAEIQDRRDRQ